MTDSFRMAPPDRQAYDEVRIVTVPRYKTSELSGDEWRISANVELLYKGKVMYTEYFHTVEDAMRNMPFAIERASEYRARNWSSSSEDEERNRCESLCDQEGCKEPASVTYKLRLGYCGQCGHGRDTSPVWPGGTFRRFCQRHAIRGDCGREDADRNYECTAGTVTQPTVQSQDVSPAVFGGFITTDGIVGATYSSDSE